METLNEYPKVDIDFIKNTINSMFNKENIERRYKWIKKKHKWMR